MELRGRAFWIDISGQRGTGQVVLVLVLMLMLNGSEGLGGRMTPTFDVSYYTHVASFPFSWVLVDQKSAHYSF